MATGQLVVDATLENTTKTEQQIQHNLNEYYHDRYKIDLRLLELENEMDLETYLDTETAALTIAGIVLSLTADKRWVVLPLAATLIMLSRIIKRGKYNPVIRRMGLRTRAEIDKEKYALKALRGDFQYLLDVPNAVWTAVNK